MRSITLASIRIISIICFLSLTVSILKAKESTPIAEFKNQIAIIESELASAKSKADFEKLKPQLNELLQKLKQCEVTNTAQIENLAKIQADVPPSEMEQPTRIETTTKDFKLAETQLNSQLLECKYLGLQANQLREKLLTALSSRQMSDYFLRSDIYRSETPPHAVTLFSSKAQNFYLFFAAYIALLIIVVQYFVTRNINKPKLLAFAGVTSTLICSVVAVLVANIFHLLDSNATWLIWCSFLLLGKILSNQQPTFSLAQGLIVGGAITSSTLLVDPLMWESARFLHGGIMLLALVTFYLLSATIPAKFFRIIFNLLLIPVIILEALEYHTAAHQILILSNIVLIIVSFHQIAIRFFDSLIALIMTSKITAWINIPKQQTAGESTNIPGVNWIRWTFYLSLMVLSFLSLLEYSGLSENFIERVQSAFYDGFNIGTVLINLKNILVATLIFGVLVVVAWIIKLRIEQGETLQTSQQVGSQTAKAALFWYSAILTAFLVALSVSGFSVQNLALIAGAFSVGIGFGLQNIVSNFVCGIILLIERPVKPGDWVIIGNTEGLVQKISIRATQLRTFDKADILIPNSELITNQVTNLMLSDNIGRLTVSVGVAYGSDTGKVMNILSDIVNQHPDVIHHDGDLKPNIVFRQFGESSLDFEIRCFLNDIKQIIRVRSEIHLAIDEQFRLNQIEIPFPQRDLHIRSWDPKAAPPKFTRPDDPQ